MHSNKWFAEMNGTIECSHRQDCIFSDITNKGQNQKSAEECFDGKKINPIAQFHIAISMEQGYLRKV